jgi:Tfp pilus assembly protein PilZ
MRNRAAFLDAYFSRGSVSPDAVPVGSPLLAGASAGAGGGLFIPGELDVELGEDVDVEIHFTEEQVRFHIRARVKWKRTTAGRRAIPPGVGIEFLPSEQRTQQQILRFAEGKESVNHVDRLRRWSLAVDVRVSDELHGVTTGTTNDISEGGCFVLTQAPLEVGAPVEVKLKAPGTLFGWLTLPGYVAWRRQEPGRDGVGIEFSFDSVRKREKVKKIVHVLRERSLRDVRIKVPRVASTPPTTAGDG